MAFSWLKATNYAQNETIWDGARDYPGNLAAPVREVTDDAGKTLIRLACHMPRLCGREALYEMSALGGEGVVDGGMNRQKALS
jgi:hypothetical protein